MESPQEPLEPELRQDSKGLEPVARGRAASDIGANPRGKAYTQKPALAASPNETGATKKKRSPWLAIALVAATLAISGLVWKHDALPHWMYPWAAAQQEQALTLTAADIDYPATEAARAALARGEIPPVLAKADLATRQNVLSGKENLYTKQLLNQSESGIVVHARVSSGGVFLGEDVLTTERPHGTTFPAGPGAPAHFHFTVEQAGPKGVVNCWVNTVNGGMATTRPMATGESADLEVLAR